MAPHPATLGVILAGGLARRMGGGDKPLLELGGRTLLALVQERLEPQCDGIVLSANDDPSRFSAAGLTVVPDSVAGHPGPLAGILAGLDWAAAHRPDLEWVASVPGDTPFLPRNLVSRLHAAREGGRKPIACAASGAYEHYAVGLWPVGLRHDLRHALAVRGLRRVEDWAKSHGMATASWPAEPFDPFFNINGPEDLTTANALVERASADGRYGKPGGTSMIELDLSGLKCPLPVLRTRKALMTLGPGDQLRVICTDPLAGIDLPNLVRELGDVLVEQRQEERRMTFLIAKALPAK